MFESNKWARQTAIVVLIHAAALIIFEVSGIDNLESHGLALLSVTIAVLGIHRSNGNQMFKGEKWKDEAAVTLVILPIVALPIGPVFPITLGIMHAVVWFIRKKTGGDKKSMSPMDDVKVGSPF